MAMKAKRGRGEAEPAVGEKGAASQKQEKHKAKKVGKGSILKGGPSYGELARFAGENPPPASWYSERAADLT
jgi:hypothetical protein